ncbi:MAG: ABC transporter permease [Bowdeniella nasicola]|nr:ABC transporter permease [Bowdeniella nasicola]
MSSPTTAQKPQTPPETDRDATRERSLARDLMSSSGMLVFLSIVLSLLFAAILAASFNPAVRESASYFFARPSDFLGSFGNAMRDFFTSLFRGAIFDYEGKTFVRMIRPLTDSLTNAVPLIFAGLAVAVAFRAGLFNIGAQGQLIIGALVGGYVGIAWDLPPVIHLLVAVLGAMIGGAAWGAIPGLLKAKSGANEVIVTIMLNSVAGYLLSYALKTTTYIGTGHNGKSQYVRANAQLPDLLGSHFRLHLGFILALLAAAFVWWLLERSTLGFEIRAAGANPHAARTAGISVNRTIMVTMAIAGGLAGLAAIGPALGTEKFLSGSIAATYGFDAITVALLGRSRPGGVVLAGILFGALNSGASLMQGAADIPVDIVQVSQAVIVLLIAAPPLVRWLLRLPEPTARLPRRRKEVA